ncbi:MAG TPA: SRPBCC domain-containing protein [Candidatus Eisenbacteria bacterium]|nr:SRPBCC domain-containing protein [Candidatus Eisenbacteria bacterium]
MTQATLEDHVLDIDQTLEIKAAPAEVYEGLLRRLCHIEGVDGRPDVILKLERRPGGRYYRDLGNDAGHLWGIVQSIKPPFLIEFFGPMMMSHPVAGHLIVRLAEIPGGTKLDFRHRAFGMVPPELKEGLPLGWGQVLQSLKRDVER